MDLSKYVSRGTESATQRVEDQHVAPLRVLRETPKSISYKGCLRPSKRRASGSFEKLSHGVTANKKHTLAVSRRQRWASPLQCQPRYAERRPGELSLILVQSTISNRTSNTFAASSSTQVFKICSCPSNSNTTKDGVIAQRMKTSI